MAARTGSASVVLASIRPRVAHYVHSVAAAPRWWPVGHHVIDTVAEDPVRWWWLGVGVWPVVPVSGRAVRRLNKTDTDANHCFFLFILYSDLELTQNCVYNVFTVTTQCH